MRIKLERRRVIHGATALAATAVAGATLRTVHAQDFKKPLRIIVPLPAGGVADSAARFFAEQWTGLTKQTVVIDNRPGGSYLIGVQQLMNSAADGNTWLMLSSSMTAAQAAFQKFDMAKQMVPIGMIGTTPAAIFVNAESPHKTVKDLTDWIKANPGKLNYAGVAGGIEHLSTANLLKRYGLTGTMIAFKGGPDSCTALAQNEIHMAITALPMVIPFKGRIRPLALMIPQRSPLTPEVPTYREQGLDVPELNYWGAFAVPTGTPTTTIDAMQKIIVEVLKEPTFVGKLATQGMIARTSDSQTMSRIIAEEIKWMTPVAAELDLKTG